MMNERETNTLFLKKEAEALGMTLCGVAEMSTLNVDLLDLPPGTVEKFPFGISLALKLSDAVIEGIIDQPNRLYFHHYRQANNLLDSVAFKISALIDARRYHALPVAASQVIDWQNQRGHLSHKKVAVGAGLGWVGRSNLFITPQFGARVRLVTILTDLPLIPDKPITERCGDCVTCLSVCPAGAIKERQMDFDHRRCYEQLKYFKEKINLGHYICGICIKACKGKRREETELR
jgi:epoxyqueuosine reductase QueG